MITTCELKRSPISSSEHPSSECGDLDDGGCHVIDHYN